MSIKILGLESSCDDTSAAIVESGPNILSNVVIGQYQEHEAYKGVVPEIAARSHLQNIQTALDRCLLDSNLSLSDIDAVAATSGPGLIGGVIVGSTFGKAISSVINKPFIAINHLEGHALTPRLTNKIEFPYLLLLASGGHCQFIAVEALGKYKILGQTLDDAIGEAFDKVAKMMNLGFPGGPIIEKLAKQGCSSRFDFPRPLYNQPSCNMSFSGLKTAVKLQLNKMKNLDKQDMSDISASFQKAVCDVVYRKTKIAMKKYESYFSAKNLVISGGVAANQEICSTLRLLAIEKEYNFVAPPIKLCTDNGAMIAFAGLERFKSGRVSSIDTKPRARWSLEDVT